MMIKNLRGDVMKLSIIIPVYNTEKYVAGCLDSVIDPSLSDYEIIVVNDGSTDQSAVVLQHYSDRFPGLVRVVQTENGGLGHARNIGISLASGSYFLFVDSDDRLAEHALSEMLSCLDSGFDVLVFDFCRVFENGKPVQRISGSDRAGVFSFSGYPEILFSPINACNKLWKRSLFIEHSISFPDRLWFEDLATVPLLYLKSEKIRYESKAWYLYLQRQGSITNSSAIYRNREMMTVLDRVFSYYRENGAFDEYCMYLEYLAFYHEFLTAIVRVNKTDPGSDLQILLRDHFLSTFPDCRQNPFIRKLPAKYRLLKRLIENNRWTLLHTIMSANNVIRGNL